MMSRGKGRCSEKRANSNLFVAYEETNGVVRSTIAYTEVKRKADEALFNTMRLKCSRFIDGLRFFDGFVNEIMMLQRPESDCVYILLSIFSGSASVRCSQANPLSCGNAKQEREKSFEKGC